jgi:alcohol dehydrogenase (cytochrome c)
MRYLLTNTLALLPCLVVASSAYAEGDAVAGKTVFENQCANCHTTVIGKDGFGPSLAGVLGRRSGTLTHYKYSTAMTDAGLTWDSPTLDSFLTSSTALVPGTPMAVAITDPTTRANVIAFLSTLGSASSSPEPAAQASEAPLGAGPTDNDLLQAAADRSNWLYANKDFAGQRYVASKQITAANVARLRPVCIYRSDNIGATQTNPLVYKGTMYLTINEATVAIDAATCRQRWSHNWILKDGAISKVSRGVALKDGRLVRGTPDGYLIALNMNDGSLLWSRKIADAKAGQYLSMPPLIFEDEIVYGPAGADFGPKNWVGAFNLKSGEPLWRFNLVPDAGEPGAETWKDPKSLEHGGGSVWTPLSLDAAKGVLYVPVGNPAPDLFGAARPGDNLYTNSAVALDVRSGKLLWFHQFGPADVHDRDLSQVSPLFSARMNGQSRNLMAISGKDGLLRVLDRDSHEQLYELPITSRTGWNAAPTIEGAHSCPGLLGGMEWNGPAYSPVTRNMYIAAVDWCSTFTKTEQAPQFTSEAHYYGGAVSPDPRDQARGWLRAIDAATGKERWVRHWPTPLVAGITATAGGLLFTGDMDNNFLAIDANSGQTLYTFNTGGSVAGGVISYELNGRQYVATTSGAVSGFFGGSGPAAIIVFALPESPRLVSLPASLK